MKSRLLRSCVAAGAVALFLAGGQRASADTTLSLTFSQASGGSVSFSLNGKAGSTSPGPYFWNQQPPPNGGSNPVATFCIDLKHGISSSAITYHETAVASARTITHGGTLTVTQATNVANAIEALYSKYYNNGWNTPPSNTYTLPPGYAAFQLALWELVYDGTADLGNPTNSNFFTSGSFKSTDSQAGQAQTILSDTLANVSAYDASFSSNHPGMQLVALTDPTCTNQDQLILLPSPKVPPSAAPAPPALLLAGFGLFALLGRARWNRRGPTPA